jgi:hypothetical protein
LRDQAGRSVTFWRALRARATASRTRTAIASSERRSTPSLTPLLYSAPATRRRRSVSALAPQRGRGSALEIGSEKPDYRYLSCLRDPSQSPDPPARRRSSTASYGAPSATRRSRSRRRPAAPTRATGSCSPAGARSAACRRSRPRRPRSRRSWPRRPTAGSGPSRSAVVRRRSPPRTARRTIRTRATRARSSRSSRASPPARHRT